jgi:hypothetical protein
MTQIIIRVNCEFNKELEEELLFIVNKIIPKIQGVNSVSYFNEEAIQEEE